MTTAVWLFISLLAAGYAICLFLPFQIRRSWDLPWLPLGMGEWRVPSFSISLRWVEVPS